MQYRMNDLNEVSDAELVTVIATLTGLLERDHNNGVFLALWQHARFEAVERGLLATYTQTELTVTALQRVEDAVLAMVRTVLVSPYTPRSVDEWVGWTERMFVTVTHLCHLIGMVDNTVETTVLGMNILSVIHLRYPQAFANPANAFVQEAIGNWLEPL